MTELSNRVSIGATAGGSELRKVLGQEEAEEDEEEQEEGLEFLSSWSLWWMT